MPGLITDGDEGTEISIAPHSCIYYTRRHWGNRCLRINPGAEVPAGEASGSGVVGLRPTCFSSDLQESPESRFSATPKATLLSAFPGVSSLLLTGPAEPPRPQLAGSSLVRGVYLKGRPRPKARAAHSEASPRVADKRPQPCPTSAPYSPRRTRPC